MLKGFLRIEPSVAGQWKKGPGTLRTENIEEGQRVAVPSAFNRSSVFRLGEHHFDQEHDENEEDHGHHDAQTPG